MELNAKIEVVNGQKAVHSAHIIFPAKDAPKVKREQKKHQRCRVFSPCRHRKDIVMVSKLRKYIGNPSLTSKSGWQQALVAHRNSGSAAAAKAS